MQCGVEMLFSGQEGRGNGGNYRMTAGDIEKNKRQRTRKTYSRKENGPRRQTCMCGWVRACVRACVCVGVCVGGCGCVGVVGEEDFFLFLFFSFLFLLSHLPDSSVFLLFPT